MISHQIVMELKQVILIRSDLKLPKGKMSAQAAHAAVEAAFRAEKAAVLAWRKAGMKKVVLKVKDEKELLAYFQRAKDLGLAVSLITDAGKTVVAPGTMTCCGIGPNPEDEIDKVTGSLPMMG